MNTRKGIKTVLSLVVMAMAIIGLTAAPVLAAVQTYTEIIGGDDSWNIAGNWSAAIPSGTDDAVISDGDTASVNNAATPVYSGSLTLRSNSLLNIGGTAGSQNAFVGASSIIMNAGSTLEWNMNANLNFPPITLLGDATLETPFGASDHQIDNFDAITGAYTLTINGFNNHTFNLNETNTFSALNAICSDRYNIRAKAPGSLGTGDVTITPRSDGRSARLYLDVEDTIANTATLYLNGTAGQGGYAGDGIDWVVVAAGIDEIVAGLYLYGVPLAPGTYNGGDSTTDWIGGSGSVTVVPIIPPDASPANLSTVPAGDVELSWTNLPPNTGSDVWVDVWFGTDPGSMTKEVTADPDGLNLTSFTVSAPVADTYYWQVNSYLDGSPTGDPIEGTVFIFYVIDTDGDGMPDDYELLYTDPPSPTALNPGDDLEPDGLTNIEEYQIGTEPDNPDTDGDTLEDGPELAGVGLRPPTDPLDADTDDDGLNDGVETNTGNYLSSTDTGTDPTVFDSDADGLGDGIETNTGVFVDETDTGTHPLEADSDSDGAGDWYEVIASFTDPTVSGDKPIIPYPLPDPDGSTGATDKPVKVYIMSGQSNMVGFGRVGGLELGTLQTITGQENKFPNLVDDGSGSWNVRNDVMYRGVITAIGDGPLVPGFGANTSSFGPELGFGYVIGWYHDEPVLLIKTSQGNRSLGWDCLPPGSVSYVYNDINYGGYGDYGNWPVGEDPPTTGGWYAGKQYDDFFLDEADMGPKDWVDANLYTLGCQVRNGGVVYNCKVEHTSSAASEPGIGAEYSTYWDLHSVFNVTDILDNFGTEYPQYAEQGFEIAGFVWWQGHKDQAEPYASRYEFNMVNFINEVRDYYENRYPDNINPNAPFVLATIAFGGWDLAGAGLTVAEGQLAVSGETGNYPAFAGNVKTMEARGYWRDFGPSTQDYHYYHNAETYMLVGDALGRGMIELNAPFAVDAGEDMITWSGQQVQLDATVQEGVTVTSYAWTTNAPAGYTVEFVPGADVEDPNVTITKDAPTGDATIVTLTLEVDDSVNPPVTDTMTIDVYDDACMAAIGKGLAADYPADFDGNCIINFEDLALMASAWLSDYAITAPVPK